ncbi:MAG: tyrosine-type recombinase/integrase [Planctomycetota bacterium]
MIHVGVHKPDDRTNYQLVWRDPKTGRQKRKSSGERRRRDAEERAREFERELNAGLNPRSWQSFRAKYLEEYIPSLAISTRKEWRSIEGRFRREMDPELVSDVDTSMLSTYAQRLRDSGLAEDTIAKHLRTIHAMLVEARRWKVIVATPEITMPQRAKGAKRMKGRPIRAEDFERMLKATSEVVGSKAAPSWRHLLRGLWLSGFRLNEALDFWWDDPSRICVWDLDARRPTMVIHAELEKGNRDRPHFPLTPDFATLLRRTPEDDRSGPVFAPRLRRGGRVTRSETTVGKTISKIGEAAGVIVKQTPTAKKSDVAKPKFASAHDLRRAFGTRWALRVKPLVLKELMRHQSIQTTEEFYVQLESEELADAIWSGWESAGRDKPREQFCEHP